MSATVQEQSTKQLPSSVPSSEGQAQSSLVTIRPETQKTLSQLLPPGRNAVAITTLEEVEKIARLANQSGMFKNSETVAKACMTMLYGMENGMSPIDSLNSLYGINGRFAMYADAIADKLQRVPGVELITHECTPEICHIEIRYNGRPTHGGDKPTEVKFTIEQAKQLPNYSKNPNWKSDPESMLFARVITRIHKRYGKKYLSLNVEAYEEMQDVEFEKSMEPTPKNVLREAQKAAAVEAQKVEVEVVSDDADSQENFDSILSAAPSVTIDVPQEAEAKTEPNAVPEPTTKQVLEAVADLSQAAGHTEVAKAAQEQIASMERITQKEAMKLSKHCKDLGVDLPKVVDWICEKYHDIKRQAWVKELTGTQLNEAMEFASLLAAQKGE